MWFKTSGERIATIWATALVFVVFLAMNPLMPGRPSLRWNSGSGVARPNTSVLNLPQDPTWVGSSYYSQFATANAAGWDEPSFFPIAVFLGKPSHSDEYAALGINTFMGLEHDSSDISVATDNVFVMAQDEWTAAELENDPKVVGWFVSDECEMGYSGCADADLNDDEVIDQYDELLAQQALYANFENNYPSGRFFHANFGNGVLKTFWSVDTMEDHVAMMDGIGVDKYAYTSPHVQSIIVDSPEWPVGADPERAGAYGWLQDEMESFMATPKPNYVNVETKQPLLTEPGARAITYSEISGAVWSSLIHGAQGVLYFQHNNDTVCGNTYSLIDCEQGVKDAVSALNAEVLGFAPVFNSPTLVWNFSASGVGTRLVSYGGYAYIFAGIDLNGTTGSKTFTLPSGIQGTSAEVVGESRSVSVSGGQFSDSFAAEYTHHVYKIAI